MHVQHIACLAYLTAAALLSQESRLRVDAISRLASRRVRFSVAGEAPVRRLPLLGKERLSIRLGSDWERLLQFPSPQKPPLGTLLPQKPPLLDQIVSLTQAKDREANIGQVTHYQYYGQESWEGDISR